MWNKIFFKDFSNFNFTKKKKKTKEMEKREKRKKKKGRAYFVITLLFMSLTTQHIFYHRCSDTKISDMILIIKSNISL